MGYTGIPPDGKFVEDDVMIDWTKLALRYPIFRETHILTHVFLVNMVNHLKIFQLCWGEEANPPLLSAYIPSGKRWHFANWKDPPFSSWVNYFDWAMASIAILLNNQRVFHDV